MASKIHEAPVGYVKVQDISDQLGIRAATLRAWCRRNHPDQAVEVIRPEGGMALWVSQELAELCASRYGDEHRRTMTHGDEATMRHAPQVIPPPVLDSEGDDAHHRTPPHATAQRRTSMSRDDLAKEREEELIEELVEMRIEMARLEAERDAKAAEVERWAKELETMRDAKAAEVERWAKELETMRDAKAAEVERWTKELETERDAKAAEVERWAKELETVRTQAGEAAARAELRHEALVNRVGELERAAGFYAERLDTIVKWGWNVAKMPRWRLALGRRIEVPEMGYSAIQDLRGGRR